MEKVLAMADELFAECAEGAKKSVLPEKLDRSAIPRLIADSYREMWEGSQLLGGTSPRRLNACRSAEALRHPGPHPLPSRTLFHRELIPARACASPAPDSLRGGEAI